MYCFTAIAQLRCAASTYHLGCFAEVHAQDFWGQQLLLGPHHPPADQEAPLGGNVARALGPLSFKAPQPPNLNPKLSDTKPNTLGCTVIPDIGPELVELKE